MKTFESSNIQQGPLGADEWRVILSMYLLRAISITLILLLFFYMAGRLLAVLDSELKFPGFVFSNTLFLITLTLFFFLLQALFYAYQLRRRVSMRRSTGELIMSYALPVIGIIAAVYTAYAIGAM